MSFGRSLRLRELISYERETALALEVAKAGGEATFPPHPILDIGADETVEQVRQSHDAWSQAKALHRKSFGS